MKYWLTISASLVAASTFGGCGSSKGTTASETSKVKPTSVTSTSDSDQPQVPSKHRPASEQPTQNGSGSGDDSAKSDTKDNVPSSTIHEITFDDLICNMQSDIVFRPWMLTPRVQELDGQRIRIRGHMHGGVQQTKNIKQFILLRNLECKFGPGGQADHLIDVKLQDGVTTSYAGTNVVEVEGTITVNPFEGPDGNTWSIFDMAGESVKISPR